MASREGEVDMADTLYLATRRAISSANDLDSVMIKSRVTLIG